MKSSNMNENLWLIIVVVGLLSVIMISLMQPSWNICTKLDDSHFRGCNFYVNGGTYLTFRFEPSGLDHPIRYYIERNSPYSRSLVRRGMLYNDSVTIKYMNMSVEGVWVVYVANYNEEWDGQVVLKIKTDGKAHICSNIYSGDDSRV